MVHGVAAGEEMSSRFEELHRLVDSPPYDFPLDDWPKLYGEALSFRPDLILELGRGYGNSTCVFVEAAHSIGARVVSISNDEPPAWRTITRPKLEPTVGENWFQRLTALEQDLLDTDYRSIIAGSRRTLVFWDAHGKNLAQDIIRRLLPRLPAENLVLVDDIWDQETADPYPVSLMATLGDSISAGPLRSIFDEVEPIWKVVRRTGFRPGGRWISFSVPRPTRRQRLVRLVR
jgi:hypothetical protein